MVDTLVIGLRQTLLPNNWARDRIKQENARSVLVKNYTYNNGRKSFDKYPLNIITEEIYD